MASRLQDVILRGLAADRPLPTVVAPGTLYYSTDTAATSRNSGIAWESYNDAGGVPGPHAVTHNAAGSDPVNIINLAGYPGGTTTFLRGDNTFASPDGGIPILHAPSHNNGGTDEVDVKLLGGFPGGSTDFLRADGTFATPPGGITRRQVTVIIDGGGIAIATGLKTFISLPSAGEFKKWRILAIDELVTAGSIIIDVWKDTYANYPPTVADTITAAAKPTLGSAISAESSTLTGWITTFAAGDVLAFNVDLATLVKKVMLVLEFE